MSAATNWPFKGGDRVRIPNGVTATVLGADGRIVEGALAVGDDGVTYFVALTVVTLPPVKFDNEKESK